MYLFEHLDHGHIGTAMRGTPKRTDTRRDGCEKISATRCDHAHGGGRTILLMIGVEHEEEIERFARTMLVIIFRIGL